MPALLALQVSVALCRFLAAAFTIVKIDGRDAKSRLSHSLIVCGHCVERWEENELEL